MRAFATAVVDQTPFMCFVDAMLSNPELSGVPLLVLANKMDLDDAKTVSYITATLDVEAHPGSVASYPICALTR